MSKPDNIQIYDENAKQLTARYTSITTEEALPPFVQIIKNYTGTGDTALDIGSGSGRDAAWLAEHGWRVDAIDGSTALLAEAAILNNHPHIHYRYDRAPSFEEIRSLGTQYDVILMSAFIFHFDQAERQAILQFCRTVLAPAGLIYITLRRGPDSANRQIYDVPLEDIEKFSAKNGLSFHYHGRSRDSASPKDVSWDHLSLWRRIAWDHAQDVSIVLA